MTKLCIIATMDCYYLDPPELIFSTRLTASEDETVHRHGYFEIFFVQQGHISHITQYGRTTMQMGDGCLIAPDVPHNFKRFRESCSHRDYLIAPSLMKQACDFIDSSLFQKILDMKYTPLSMDRIEILSMENKVLRCLNDGDVERQKNFARTLTVTLLSYIYMHFSQNLPVTNAFYANCLQALGNAFTFPNYISLLQEELGYSRGYLCKKFKEVFGCTISDYVKEKRLEYAAHLFLTTSYTVSEICSKIGIDSLPYFNKIFREKYNCTPAKFRKIQLSTLYK